MTRYEYIEKISAERLMLILSNFDVLYKQGFLFQHDPKNDYRKITDYMTCKNMLYHYLDLHNEDGTASILYEPLKHHPTGRLWAKQLSTQGISRGIRHTICDGLMVDLDMKNAHPVLLSRICEEHNLKHDHLQFYILNRDYVIDTIVEDNIAKTREDAKKLILQIINGGSALNGDWNEWLGSFYFEMKMIRQRFQTLFPNEYKIAIKNKGKDYYNLLGSCLNLVLTSMERSILDRMINYCQFKDIKIGSLCHDGLMLHYDDSVDYNQLAKDLSEYCKITIVVKKMDEKIPLDNLVFTMLDYPYRNYSKDLLLEARKVLKDKFNSFNQAIVFNKMNSNYYDKFKFSRGVRASTSTWFEKQLNGRWLETQSPFKLSIEIAIQYPTLISKVKAIVAGELKRFGDDKEKKKHLENELAMLSAIEFKIQDLNGRNRLIDELKLSYNDDNFAEMIDKDPMLIGFDNGVYDVSLNKFRPIGNNDFINKNTLYDFPHKSDPLKRAFLLETLRSMFVPSVALKRSLEYLNEPMVEITDEMKTADEKGEEDFLFTMKVLASTLEGGNRFQKFYMFIGEGANGKSVLVKLVKKTFGEYACNIDISAFTQKKSGNHGTSDLPKTKGCHLLFTNESENSDRLNASQLKNITGDEDITERELYKSSITFTPMFVPFLLTNNAPQIKMDDAVARRLQMINFPFRFFSSQEEVGFKEIHKHKTHFLGKDPLLSDKLIGYADEFFIYLTEIYNLYVKNVDVLIPPQRHVEATNTYFVEQDTFKDYIETYYERTDVQSDWISAPMLLQHIKNNHDPGMTSQRLTIAMEKMGLGVYTPADKRRKYPIKRV